MSRARALLSALAAATCVAASAAAQEERGADVAQDVEVDADADAGGADAGAEQDEQRVLAVRVTELAGRFVTIDRGADAGLAPGDRVRLLPLGAASVEGAVRSVEDESARVELERIEPALELGTRGEVFVPRERVARQRPAWRRPEELWSEDAPLLAPARSPAPKERPPELRGRVYTRFDRTEDEAGDGRRYQRSRSGLELDWKNPFGAGGRLRFDGAFTWREARVGDFDADGESIARIRRLSYSAGGVRGMPHRFEIGRFLHGEFPELGVLDGAEYTFRTEAGSRVGASLGFLPEPFDEMKTGKDLAASVYYRWVSDEDERVALGGAYQKSWHEGEADRDLVLTTADWRLARRTSLRGSAWIDVYGSDEREKDSGVELTELHLRFDHAFATAAGLGLFASHVRFPDLLRDEFPESAAASIFDRKLSRAGVDAWAQASRHLRLGARFEGWEDELDDGHAAEARVALQDLLFERGELSLSVHASEGRFSDARGARLGLFRWFGRGALRLAYELTELEQQRFFGEQETLLQHAARAGYDLSLGADWSLSFDAELRLGDEQDSHSLGLFLQRSF